MENELLEACKAAYKRHWMGDKSISWTQLGGILQRALVNEMGEKAFHAWLQQMNEKQQKEGKKYA